MNDENIVKSPVIKTNWDFGNQSLGDGDHLAKYTIYVGGLTKITGTIRYLKGEIYGHTSKPTLIVAYTQDGKDLIEKLDKPRDFTLTATRIELQLSHGRSAVSGNFEYFSPHQS